MKIEVKVTATGVVTDAEGNILGEVPLEAVIPIEDVIEGLEHMFEGNIVLGGEGD